MLVFLLGLSAGPMNPSEVLLIEDNAGDALLVGQALAEGRVPVNLHIARDGEQALQILEQADFKPDLIILDLNLPKISGHSVLASCVNTSAVVVFTASLDDADEGRVLLLGAKEFVQKPMDLKDYKVAVCRMVRKWGAANDIDAAVLVE
jgi:chemotaxis family two-component system response regulator Rcp1